MSAETLLREALRALIAGDDLPAERMTDVMRAVMAGEVPAALLGALLAALAAKGESATEVAAAAGCDARTDDAGVGAARASDRHLRHRRRRRRFVQRLHRRRLRRRRRRGGGWPSTATAPPPAPAAAPTRWRRWVCRWI